jgi:hypothetical protein
MLTSGHPNFELGLGNIFRFYGHLELLAYFGAYEDVSDQQLFASRLSVESPIGVAKPNF